MNRITYFFIFFGLIITGSKVNGQRIITGQVVESISGRLLDKAVIIINGDSTLTNARGYFQMEADSGALITISREGYQELQFEVPGVSQFKVELLKADSTLAGVSDEIYSNSDTAVYWLVPQMPVYFGELEPVKENVWQHMNKIDKEKFKEKYVIVRYLVTNAGTVVVKNTDPDLERFTNLLEVELNRLTWLPGKVSDKAVTVETFLPLRIVNNKLDMRMQLNQVAGELITCRTIDGANNAPVPLVRLINKKNNQVYISDQNGEVTFPNEPGDEIEVEHVNYKSFEVKGQQLSYNRNIVLVRNNYILEEIDLIRYNPEKLPDKKECEYAGWVPVTGTILVSTLYDIYVPEMALFDGDFKCLRNYVAENFIYPEEACRNNYSGDVTVSFTVDKEGEVTHVSLSKSLDYGLDNIITTLFETMPAWKPAVQAMIHIEQQFSIKLIFGNNRYWNKLYD